MIDRDEKKRKPRTRQLANGKKTDEGGELFTGELDHSISEKWAEVEYVNGRLREDAPMFWAVWRLYQRFPDAFTSGEKATLRGIRRGSAGKKIRENLDMIRHARRVAVDEEMRKELST